MPVTPPGTISPGRLLILYRAGSLLLEHNCGANIVLGTDLTDIASLRGEATGFAEALMEMSSESSQAYGWRITDIGGAFLYEETFTLAIDGSVHVVDALISSESTTIGARGKGVAPTIGTGVGTTRSIFFPGYLDSIGWRNSTLASGNSGYNTVVRDFLDTSSIVGADRYGQKAHYREDYTLQVNSHFQKQFGL